MTRSRPWSNCIQPFVLRSLPLFCVLLLGALPVSAQRGEEDPPPRTSKSPIPQDGFWPTRLMMQRAFERVNEAFAGHYEMDDDQRERSLRVFRARVMPFLEENRGELQKLTNEFYETLLNDRPPSIELVAEWSQKVLPLMDELKGVVGDISTDMQEFMTDDQISKLESELAAFDAGLGIARNKLQSWADGGYDPELEWPGLRMDLPPEERKAREERKKAEREAEMQRWREEHERESASQPSSNEVVILAQKPRVITDEWEIHTENFIKRYDLDADQQQKARAILRGKQEERDEYLRKKADELDKVKARGDAAKSPDEQQAAREEFERLNAPVDRHFAQLKSRLDSLPTRAQRKKAAEADAASRPASAPAGN